MNARAIEHTRRAPTMVRGLDPAVWRRFRSSVVARGAQTGPVLNAVLAAWLDRRTPFTASCPMCGHPGSGACEAGTFVATDREALSA